MQARTVRSVLIVDDNEPDIEYARRTLERSGRFGNVLTFPRPDHALDLFRNYEASQQANPDAFPPQLVLLDINMPQMSGFDFLTAYEEIRETTRSNDEAPAFVLLSGSANEADQKRSAEFPRVMGYSKKPMNLDQACELADRFGIEPATSNYNFRFFAERSPNLLCVVSPEGRFVWVNEQWTKTLGHSEMKMLTTPFMEFIHPDDVERTIAVYTEKQAGRVPRSFINRYRCADGSWRSLEWYGTTPSKDPFMYGIARDITVRESKDRYQSLLELGQSVSKTGHWHFDRANNRLHWSDEVFRINGLDRETFTPTVERCIEGYHPDDRALVSESLRRAIEEMEGFDIEVRLSRTDGEARLVQSIGRPEVNEEGIVTGIFGIFRDLTDDERVRRQRELEEFVHVASHDLSEPLRTIQSYLEILDEEYFPKLDEAGTKYARYVSDAASRMQSLLTDLVQLSSASRSLRLVPVDIREVLEAVRDDLTAKIEETNTQLLIEADGVVIGDAIGLHQVLLNLINNGIKFNSSPAPTIRVSTAHRYGKFIIRVEDNGIGIDAKAHDRVFDPFRRLHTRDEFDGTGIGLAIVRRIVQECRGRVWVESRPGEGSSFYVALPEAPTSARGSG